MDWAKLFSYNVHFPLVEKLNHIISTLPHFDNTIYKLGYAITEYIVFFVFSIIMVLFCNRFLPTLTEGIKQNKTLIDKKQSKTSMRPLHIIMPMAGEGSRFLKEGWTTPKPLIQLHGKELFLCAIGSVSGDGIPMKYSFIVRQEHIEKYEIDKSIKAILPDANIFSVLKTTRGAVETCLMAREAIAQGDAVLVMDCDLEFRSKGFNDAIANILSKPVEEVNGGMLVSFDSNESRYSYAETDETNRVLRTAEKEIISNHALCGAYFFSNSASFLYAADSLMNETNFNKPEYFVSLLYNYLLKRGDYVGLAKIEEYYSYGTPEELKCYL